MYDYIKTNFYELFMLTQEQLIEAVKAVHGLTNKGEAIEAMKQYYADNVVMIESDGTATEGLEANLAREEEFFASITAMRSMTIDDTFVYSNPTTQESLVVTTSSMDFDIKGEPIKGQQVSITNWENDKVVREQFIYKSF
jgi:hypothetical protein